MTPRNLIRAVLAAIGLAGATLPCAAFAQTATTPGEARAIIISPINLTSVNALDFGTQVAAPQSFTVIVDPAASRTSTSGPGRFTVTGQANRSYTVALPASFNLSASASQVTVSDLTYRFDGATQTGGTGAFDTSGASAFNVGATLTVGPNQTPGDYRGTYPVTVRYQ